MNYKYLSVSADSKTRKGEKFGYLTAILYLSPAQVAGGRNMCPFSTAGCRRVCLNLAGRGAMNMVQQARIRKTREFLADPIAFVAQLQTDITGLIKEAKNKGLIPAVRLNGVTDVQWEKYSVMAPFPDVFNYDYTKFPAGVRKDLPKNYHLTYSHSEHPKSWERSEEWFKRGVNTAVVFAQRLPDTYKGRPVINGDESDLRFTDPQGVYVGLKTKGKARKDDGDGFVVTSHLT
jgi:hypothetical protein